MYDEDKVDDMVLALLHLTTFKDHGADRASRELFERHFGGDPAQ